jgi:hypothetical protein
MAKTTLVRAGQTQYYLDGEITVSTAAGLTAALADSAFTKITLAADISTPEKLVVSRPVVIDGAGKSLTMTGDAAGWQGNYVLQVYNTTGVTISGIKLTGGDGALLVNGSEVVLTGAIDVSGNEFGGMESSKGVGLTRMPKLDVTNATLVNSSEAYGKPTIWEDGADITGTVIGFGTRLTATTLVKVNQVQYYLDGEILAK